MSRLDELKNGSQNQDIDIDMTAGIDGLNHNKPSNPAPVVTSGNRVNMANGNRKRVDINNMRAALAPNNVDEKENNTKSLVSDPEALANDILNGKDSVFAKWKQNKINEYQERMARFDEEREEMIEEGLLDPKDIKDPEYHNGDEDYGNIDEDDEEFDINSEEYTKVDNSELVLDEDDILAESTSYEEREEAIAREIDEDDYPVDDIDDDDEPGNEIDVIDDDDWGDEADMEEEVVEVVEEPKEEKKVHITEEDKELFDTIGTDVDSSRFESNDDEDDEEKSPIKSKNAIRDYRDSLEDEDDEEDDDNKDDDDPEETLKHLKELITAKLRPTFKNIDINQFKIVTKKSTTNIRPLTDGVQRKVVKWVLPNQKQCVFMKQFTGLELQTLSENIQDGSTTSMNIAYRSIYDHIVSNKPKKFTDWLAVTPDSDIDHYMFCVFIASFKGTNYLPMNCDNDNCPDSTFLTDDIPIMDMVKFKDDEAKDKFTEIYKSEIVYSNKSAYYVSARVPVSNNIAISFKESTLKDVIDIESLDEKFRNKYSTVIGLIPYIDDIYQIDMSSQSLIKIEYEEFDSYIRTFKAKIRKYSKIIDTFSPDEFGVISSVIQSITQRDDMLSYVIPETECPACGKVIKEVSTSATQLVFTRYQLGALVNTTLN